MTELTTNYTRIMYYTIITDKDSVEDSEDEDIFHCFTTVKEQMLRNNRRQLVILEMENITGLVVKRIMEYLFEDTNNDVTRATKTTKRKQGRPTRSRTSAEGKEKIEGSKNDYFDKSEGQKLCRASDNRKVIQKPEQNRCRH